MGKRFRYERDREGGICREKKLIAIKREKLRLEMSCRCSYSVYIAMKVHLHNKQWDLSLVGIINNNKM